MKHFLRDVAALALADVIAAVVVRILDVSHIGTVGVGSLAVPLVFRVVGVLKKSTIFSNILAMSYISYALQMLIDRLP